MRFTIYTAVLILLLLADNARVKAADNFTGSGPLVFSQRQSQVQPGNLASNVIRVVNTGRQADYTLRISSGAGFQLLGSRERNFSLAAGDTLYVPIRVMPSTQLQSPEPQTINAALFRQGSLVASADWIVTPQLRSDWSAFIARQQIILPSGSDTTQFRIHVTNNGNLYETLRLNLTLAPGLSLLNSAGQTAEPREMQFSLAPRSDTIIQVHLQLEKDGMHTRHLQTRTGSKRIRVQISQQTTAAPQAKTWGTNVDIRQVENIWKQNHSPFRSMPLTAELQAYDILGNYSYGSLSLYGRHVFADESSLSYYLQSNFTSNYLNPRAFLGQYLHINYESKYFGAELGNISQSNEGSNLSGEGAKAWGNYGPHHLGVTWAATPGVFNREKIQEGMGAEYRYTGIELRAGAWAHHRENYQQKTEDGIAGLWAGYRFLQNQHLRLSAAFSRQDHNWNPDSTFRTDGLGITANYNGRVRNIAYNAMYAYNSSAHLVRRGTQSISSRVTWRINRQNNLFAAWFNYRSDPDFYYRGSLRELNLYRERQIYRVGWQHNGQLSALSLQPLYERYLDPWLNYHTSGIDTDYRLLDFHFVRFFGSAFAGYTQIMENDSTNYEPVFVARLRASIRYFQYALNLRYYYGPYYSNELRRFAEEGISSNRFTAGLNFDRDLAGGALLFRMSSLYSYTTYNKQNVLSFRPELFYFPQPGLRFGVYARYYGLSTGQENVLGIPDLSPGELSYSSSRFEFGFSIRKDFNIPVSGRKFYALDVVVYRDVSASGTKDRNDPGVPDVWIRLQAMEVATDGPVSQQSGQVFEAITNKDGKAMFVNIAPGTYLLSLIPVAQASSRHETRTMEVMVSNDHTLYVSIDRGARVAGSIFLDRDQFTRAEYFPLGGIRITATDKEGQQFSTLTSEGGNYSLYLPRGSYNIAVNEQVFGQDLQLQQNNVAVEVLHPQEIITVNFTARERTRQIRIQQPGNNRQPTPSKTEPEDE